MLDHPQDGYGALPGLDRALLDMARGYRPGATGPCVIPDIIEVSLPYLEAYWWCFGYAPPLLGVAGASTAEEILYTVPDDRRCYLDWIEMGRYAGDNTVSILGIRYPEGYFDTNDLQQLLIMTTASGNAFWPDPGGRQDVVACRPGPLLLEPGTQVIMYPGGGGVTATNWSRHLGLRLSAIVRARGPT